jgi:hypothetical protein
MKSGITYVMAAMMLLASVTFSQRSVAQADEAFILLSSGDAQSMNEAASLIEGKGGRIVHRFPYHVLIGNVPPSIAGEIVGQKNILSINYGIVNVSSVQQYGGMAIAAVNFWNEHLQPSVEEPGIIIPPVDDAISEPLGGPQALNPGIHVVRLPWGNAYGAGEYDTSEYMIGTASVNVILVESTGNGENWSNPGPCSPDCPREAEVTTEIIVGLNWYANLNANAHLAWTWHFYYGRTDWRAQTTVEPITLNKTDEDDYIDEIMTNFGYTGGYLTKVRNFDNDTRNSDNTDWAFTIFVVDSNNDADGRFADNNYAWGYFGGPLLVETYDNAWCGHDAMDFVTAHEAGHIFYALDEYYGPSSCSDHHGYLDVENQNYNNSCAMNDPNGIMRQGASPPYLSNSNVSPYTRGQIGWGNVGSGGPVDPQIGDTDQDSISNIIDFNPTITLNAYTPDPTTDNTPTYTGSSSTTTTLPNANPHYTVGQTVKHDIQVNKIVQVQYRVDSGSWADATASDGTFDEYSEDYTFTSSALSPGPHTIETRARNTAGNWSSLASDTLTIIATYTVTANANVAGTGSGTVTSDVGGINFTYPANNTGTTSALTSGSNIVLTATAGTGSNATWTDCASQSGTIAGNGTALATCTYNNLTSNMTFSVTFTLNTYTLTVTVVGAGTVTSNPAGINCGSDCSEVYTHGTTVTLTATPTATSIFLGWSGDCTGTALTCTFTMDGAKNVTATFGLKQGKKVQPSSLLPLARNNIAKANGLLSQANDLLSRAKEKNLDTASCEKVVEEARALLEKSMKHLTNPVYANNLALQAIEKLMQAIECLKAL